MSILALWLPQNTNRKPHDGSQTMASTSQMLPKWQLVLPSTWLCQQRTCSSCTVCCRWMPLKGSYRFTTIRTVPHFSKNEKKSLRQCNSWNSKKKSKENYDKWQNVREYGAVFPCSRGRTCVVPRMLPVPESLCQSTLEDQSTPRWFHLSTRQLSLHPSVQRLSADHKCHWRRRHVPDRSAPSRVQTPWIGRTASVNKDHNNTRSSSAFVWPAYCSTSTATEARPVAPKQTTYYCSIIFKDQLFLTRQQYSVSVAVFHWE